MRPTVFVAAVCMALSSLPCVASESEAISWRLGKTDTFTIDASITQTGNGGKDRVYRDSTYSLTLRVTSVAENGAAEVVLKVESARIRATVEGKSLEVDTEKPAEETPATPDRLAFIAELAGKEFSLCIAPGGAGDVLPVVDGFFPQAPDNPARQPLAGDFQELLEFVFNFAPPGEAVQERTWKKFLPVPLSRTFSGVGDAMEERKYDLGRRGSCHDNDYVEIMLKSTLCKPAEGATTIGGTGQLEGPEAEKQGEEKGPKPPAPPQGSGSGSYRFVSEGGWLLSGEMKRIVSAKIDRKECRLETKVSVEFAKESGTDK
ncbi:MAG: hypothetical protein RDV41_10750 [Planctomycetota bacterium]|nr:hypothetical protein [Planctomycetota bacterium]